MGGTGTVGGSSAADLWHTVQDATHHAWQSVVEFGGETVDIVNKSVALKNEKMIAGTYNADKEFASAWQHGHYLRMAVLFLWPKSNEAQEAVNQHPFVAPQVNPIRERFDLLRDNPLASAGYQAAVGVNKLRGVDDPELETAMTNAGAWIGEPLLAWGDYLAARGLSAASLTPKQHGLNEYLTKREQALQRQHDSAELDAPFNALNEFSLVPPRQKGANSSQALPLSLTPLFYSNPKGGGEEPLQIEPLVPVPAGRPMAKLEPDIAKGKMPGSLAEPPINTNAWALKDDRILTLRGHAAPISGVYTVGDLFPNLTDLQNGKIDKIYVELLQACASLGLPFPIERNAEGYARWADSWHEVAHWVKPAWYLDSFLRTDKNTKLSVGDVVIEPGQVHGIDHRIVIKDLMTYDGIHGRIPDIGLYHDMTPCEMETRAWSLQTLDVLGWPHPMDASVHATANSCEVPKLQTLNVWNPALKNDPEVLAKLRQFGVDVANNQFVPIDDGFRLPHPKPVFLEDVIENFTAVNKQYGNEVPLTSEQKYAWRQQLIAGGYPSRHEKADRRDDLLQAVSSFDKTLNKIPEVISLGSLMPANAQGETAHFYRELVKLAEQIGVPVPMEPKSRYQTWWRFAHEMGHYAHLPDWYNALYAYMYRPEMRRISVAAIGAAANGPAPLLASNVLAFKTGNDVIPSLGFLRDPLHSEVKVRAWTLGVIERFGWKDALRKEIANDTYGAGRIWALAANTGEERQVLAASGIDPQRGLFRPADDGFRPPYMTPRNVDEIMANHDAILGHYGGQVKASRFARNLERMLPTDGNNGRIDYTQQERDYLEGYFRLRFPEGSLGR